MAHYTMELHRAIEFMGGRIEFPGEGDNNTGYTRVIGGRIPFDTYPIFDEDHRKRLNGLILDTYYLHEIAHETPEIFTMRFRQMMQLHMPTFNKMYIAELKNVDPLNTIDMKTIAQMIGREDTASETEGNVTTSNSAESNLDKNSTTNATSEAKSRARAINSEYPQHMLSGNEDYASAGADTNSQNETQSEGSGTDQQHSTAEEQGVSDSTSRGKSEADTRQDSESQRVGYEGHKGELIARYRATLANIDELVIVKLRPLFFGLWQNGDTYTERGYYRAV